MRHAGIGSFISTAGNVYFFGRDSVKTEQVEPQTATTTSSVNIAVSGDYQHVGKIGASYPPTMCNTINTTNATVAVQRTLSVVCTRPSKVARVRYLGDPDGAQIICAPLGLFVNVPANADGRNLTPARVRNRCTCRQGHQKDL